MSSGEEEANKIDSGALARWRMLAALVGAPTIVVIVVATATTAQSNPAGAPLIGPLAASVQ